MTCTKSGPIPASAEACSRCRTSQRTRSGKRSRTSKLEVYTDNEPAIHLYEKFGFVIEGTKRRYALRDGEYVDAHTMARVRD